MDQETAIKITQELIMKGIEFSINNWCVIKINSNLYDEDLSFILTNYTVSYKWEVNKQSFFLFITDYKENIIKQLKEVKL
jgi:hypothetical protein